jgi:large repetitive protein
MVKVIVPTIRPQTYFAANKYPIGLSRALVYLLFLKEMFAGSLGWLGQARAEVSVSPIQRNAPAIRSTGGSNSLLSSPARGWMVVLWLILAFILLLGSSNLAFSGTEFCSDYKKHPDDTIAIIDGNDPFVRANLPSSSFGIDMNCEFRNFMPPAWPDGLTPTLNFKTSDKSQIYLIVFDNVYFTGNMACASIAHKLWAVNSYGFKTSCQDIMIPAEAIDKQAPAATANIGEPFTYSLTLPAMNYPAGAPSPNDLGNITVKDDLTATGADLTLLGLNAYYKGSGTPVPITYLSDSTEKFLHFTLPNIDAGQQVVVEMTVVLDDTPDNAPGKTFINTANWWFSRWIDLNENGIRDPNEFFNPLPGEWGVSAPIRIVAPNLVVSKTSPATALNITDLAVFTIDVQNSGGGDAWNTTVTDKLPEGMCAFDPTDALEAKIVQADGTLVKELVRGDDYTVTPDPYSGGCEFLLALTGDQASIGPQQRLILTYPSQLDPEFTDDGALLTNIAGATRWYSANSTHSGRREFVRSLTDGTPGTLDHEDSHTVMAALHGYYFEKTVQNLTSLANPAKTAAPGDTLRYRLRVFNVDQKIEEITLRDTLNLSYLDPATFGNVRIVAGEGYNATYTFDGQTGLLQITGAPLLNVTVRGELVIEFDITLRPGLANGTEVANQALLTAADGFTAKSDDPYVNGVASPDVEGDEDPTVVVIQTPGPLAKANGQPTATIGEHFEYIITIPATASSVPLYDVKILDTLPSNLRFVSARVLTGGAWTIANTGTGNNLVLEDTVTGIDVPAKSLTHSGQARIAIMVEVLNSTPNQSSVTFSNTASYTYNRANGVESTRLAEGGNTTPTVRIVEPLLTAAKTASFVFPGGKSAAAPAAVGDILEYAVTIRNLGTSTAFDVNIVDTLPENLALVAESATATINGVPVIGFIDEPAAPYGNTLVWGRDNGDGSLEIPPGQSLVLTYQVTVVDTTLVTSFTNSVFVDWTSLEGDYPIDSFDSPFPGRERTGEGCGTTGITLPNDYCAGPVTVTVEVVDNTSIAKSVYMDSYPEVPASTGDPIVRVGDTATYDLILHLQEYTTRQVVVEDMLPAGMVLQSFSILGGVNFSYLLGARPAEGDTGTLRWAFGDIINTPDGDPTNDTLVIRYVAGVLIDPPLAGVGYEASILLDNTARLFYAGGDPTLAPDRLTATARIDVRQPQMGPISKVDLGSDRIGTGTETDPYQVDISSDRMSFRLESCNDGLAPAYGVIIADLLASEFNEAHLTATPPVVKIDAITVAGSDYAYTAPGRGGTMQIELSAPVHPAQCVTVDYSIGFHNDFGPRIWNNSATLPYYRSLPVDGRPYTVSEIAQVWMTNLVKVEPLSKTLLPPVEVTIGAEVVYQLTVPATPMNAALSDVVVTDFLHGALAYVSASAAMNDQTIPLMDHSVAPGQVVLHLGSIPAGQQAVITLTARVANVDQANAGTTIVNVASYIYTGMPPGATTDGSSEPLTIVEPAITLGKTFDNVTHPGVAPTAGDVLHYTLTLTAAGGLPGDDFADAFDLSIIDSLSLGLTYVLDSAMVAGTPLNPSVVTGDGLAVPQVLTWTAEDSNLHIVEGTQVTITYQVQVLENASPGQVLSNRATGFWTSLLGANDHERTGADCPDGLNRYCTTDSTAVTVDDHTTLAKVRMIDTWNNDGRVRVGDFVEYELRLGLQEGTHHNLLLTDTLPTGLVFDSMVSADFFGVPQTLAPAVSGQTVTWNLGTVVNPADGDASNDYLVIVYRARVLNNDTLAQEPTRQELANAVTLDYTIAGNPAAQLLAREVITVLQPLLAVSKSVSAAGGDSVIASGELITYTIEISNSGEAPAYDAVLVDVLPVGLDASTLSTASVRLVNAGTVLPNFTPTYDGATRTATWNFDSGVADQYTIPVGETLRLIYTINADNDFAPNLTLVNAATVTHYHSFDNDAVPVDGDVTQREVYGPSNIAEATLTTPPVALHKEATQPSASIGEPFSYRITVPAMPQIAPMHDVRIIDDLTASTADLRFVSVSKISGSQPWTPVNTGDAKQLVIQDTVRGIDIPAGEQVVIEITVVLDDSAANISGLIFNNTAEYRYNAVDDDATTELPGLPHTSDEMIVTGPDTVTLEKTGPETMRVGLPGTFTIDVHNTGSGTAWGLTITDILPTLSQGGMCNTTPIVQSSQIFQADGVTPVSPVLVQGSDYLVAFSGSPDCTLTISMQTAAAAIGPDQRLLLSYTASLDPDTMGGTTLTNIAAATEWFSAAYHASFPRRSYRGELTDGTPGILDEQDAHTLVTESPVLLFQKTVSNVIHPALGTVASPGDTLRYTLRVENVSEIDLPLFSVLDDLDALNDPAFFAPGTLTIISIPAGADAFNTNPFGGTKGTGLLDIRNMSLDAQGGANDKVEIVFEVTLVPVIDSGTVVLNQGILTSYGHTLQSSDDPALPGDADPTETLITSAPLFEVKKISTVLSGDPSVLMPGETLRYTITIRNIGDENAVNLRLRDDIPANTTYVAGSTTLNGVSVADPSPGVSPLAAGMLANAPADPTPGYLPADIPSSANNIATVTFDVVVDPNVMNGLIIENQGFVGGEGAGSGSRPEQPSDDPATPVADDPTRDIVGSLPLLRAHKTVQILEDRNGNGLVDPGDVLLYNITISNYGGVPATNVELIDQVPADTTYVADSLRLNGTTIGFDGGVSPLIAGLSVQSSDLPGSGIISAGASVVITFEVRVEDDVPAGTIISNQGRVTSSEIPPELTDADGNPSNGHQPTVIVVGEMQLLSITKEVLVVGGGMSEAGGQLEYIIRVNNIGSLPATQVVITDDLRPPLGDQVSYVAGSGTLNGSSAGIFFSGSMLTADYASVHGALPPGAATIVRFRVQIDPALPIGTTITNTGVVSWNNPAQDDFASVSLDLGGTPGSGGLNGNVWHDANLDKLLDGDERRLEGWSVNLYQNNIRVATANTDASGAYRLGGLLANAVASAPYELRFVAPGAGPNTAHLGHADSPFTDGSQRISDITIVSGGNLPNLNLPISPNGTVYDSVLRIPITGARLALLSAATNAPLPSGCFDDPAQQNQITAQGGYYKFDLNFSDPSCPAGAAYIIDIVPPAAGYVAPPSRIIPPTDEQTVEPFSVPGCLVSLHDTVPETEEYCEVVPSAYLPPLLVAPRAIGTTYYLHVTLSDGLIPGHSQLFNNHLPVDPELDGAVAITKTSALLNVSKGQLVPYTITVTNVFGVPLWDIGIVDRFPAGFKYVEGSARLDGQPREPQVNGRELLWDNLELQVNAKHTIQLLLVVGAGVSEGEYVNRAQVMNTANGEQVSGEATATVRVIPDPTFDCTDVVGKVFDDRNLNGQQDAGENGLAGVRVVTARGLVATTDQHGRFHITCAVVPDDLRGSNFIVKLDDRSLPTGYRLTTENPLVQRATRGKMLRYNFGATIHRVVAIDIADGVFAPDATELRLQWAPKIGQLLTELHKAPAVLRLSYLADIEREGLVKQRLEALKQEITRQWALTNGGYRLTIETEVFWRRGGPP